MHICTTYYVLLLLLRFLLVNIMTIVDTMIIMTILQPKPSEAPHPPVTSRLRLAKEPNQGREHKDLPQSANIGALIIRLGFLSRDPIKYL